MTGKCQNVDDSSAKNNYSYQANPFIASGIRPLTTFQSLFLTQLCPSVIFPAFNCVFKKGTQVLKGVIVKILSIMNDTLFLAND